MSSVSYRSRRSSSTTKAEQTTSTVSTSNAPWGCQASRPGRAVPERRRVSRCSRSTRVSVRSWRPDGTGSLSRSRARSTGRSQDVRVSTRPGEEQFLASVTQNQRVREVLERVAPLRHASDLSWEAEDRIIRRCSEAVADLNIVRGEEPGSHPSLVRGTF
jgi:hypothetical protein